MILNDILDSINEAKEIIAVTHVSPDGDGIGCITALYKAMKKLDKDISIFIDDVVPDIYKFMPYTDKITKPINKRADLLIAVDCAEAERMGSAKELLRVVPKSINIDHHVSNTLYANMNYVDTNAASSAEIVYQLIKILGIDLDQEIAESLYVGIVTDTGNFMYSSTTSFTHEVAGDLINNGVSVSKISDIIFHNIKYSKLKLISRAIDKMELYFNKKVAYMELKKEDFIETGTEISDVENIINFGRDIDGVEVAVMLIEKDGLIKGSLRSKNYVDVNKIAQKFNGGGHVRASGFSKNSSINEVKNEVLELIKNELNE
ncbi:DHH family phosphoesterase [Thermoanaerobacterium thermosaccharolyticum]|jgi:phosphoesterase RecJ-like protein|uniref:DHH family phosphoesterase n=1 Tax=Thermoanaerobacterium thermosaccharolyticum TaxID=1517 RepID=UPI001053E35A|nr:bifunctional oligoribonuclease/PAP phosphatase NrnA [Thermoanaerobacterium thermosaccharolyticum]KAA5807730.1 bifunctional oligoribonuclease/PAP phosphatase NrnA [Thermoanaerobacterium thermosaccharolyticum]TCW38644.1 phosphoesterase RecJ-like protein [Thermohydrogenium kirishiense]